jgi:hypothetical protein
MKNELDKLIQEVIDFADIIAFADRPASADFQHACLLFNKYLQHRFAEITAQLQITNCDDDTEWAVKEINRLEKLSSLPANSTLPYIQWTQNLFQYSALYRQHKMTGA